MWERMKIILRGCDRERVKSKGRRKNMKHAKVTKNLKKKITERLKLSAKSCKKARNAIISESFLSSALKKIFVGFVHLHSGTQS